MLTGLIPSIYSALDVVSRELVGVIPGVTVDAQTARAAVGQTVSSPVAPAATLVNITPGITAPDTGDQTIGRQDIVISKAIASPIRWNGEEVRGINTGPGVNTIFRDQVAQSIRAIVNGIETDLVNEIRTRSSRAYGTAGTTPFGTASVLKDSSEVLRIIEENGAQGLERSLVLSTPAMSNIRGTQSVLFKVNESGSSDLLRQGVLGELHGSMVRQSAALKPIAAGTGAGYKTNTVLAAGATVINVDTGTGTILAGDTVTIGTDPNKYVVTSTLAAGSFTINAPGLLVAQGASVQTVTVGANYTPSILFTKNSLVLASRAPALPTDPNGRETDMALDRMMITDPLTGLSFEMSVYVQYRQIHYEIALAYGFRGIKSEHAAILLG
jgi:hypothetical protein